MKQKTEVTLELSEDIATAITPIISLVDMILTSELKIEDFELVSKAIFRDIGTKEALPFPSTLNRAKELGYQYNVLKAIIDLIKARKEQRDNFGKKDFIDDEMLKEIGIL